MRTKQDYTLTDWRGYGPLTIPAGSRVSPVPTYSAQTEPEVWVEDFGNYFGHESMQFHDATHYGIRIPASVCVAPFTPWTVEGGRVVTNGRVRFYLAGCREEGSNAYQYEPVWLDRLAHEVCTRLNHTKDNGEA